MNNNMDLILTIRAVDKATATLNQLSNTSGTISTKLQKNLQNTSEKLDRVGKGSVVAGAVMATGIGLAVKSAADFEQELSNIKAITGATSGEMAKLETLSMKMGAETKYSAVEAASGIEELEKAGVSTSQVLNGALKGALDLATAGDLELADAAEIASTALNAFKDDHLSVTQAGNIMAGAANASATSVGELKYSLAMCAAVASSAGMDFMDTNTALALFAQNGLKGSDAGTSLKTMLMNLQPTTKKQIETFRELGLMQKNGTSLFYDQHGKIKDLASISGILHDKLKNLSPVQRQVAMEAMFGSDAVRAGAILFREGADGATKMATAMNKVTAAEVAATKMDNLNGTVEELSGSIETLAIASGTVLIPSFKIMATVATSIVNVLNMMPKPVKSFVVGLTALTAVGLLTFGGLAMAASGLINSLITLGIVNNATAATFVASFGKNILSATRLVLGFNAALLTNPMTWIVAGIVVGVAAVVAVTVLLIKNWDKVTAAFEKAKNAAKSFFGAIGKGGNVNVSVNAKSGASGENVPNAKSDGPMPKYDVGSKRISRTGKAIVHEGEEIRPKGSKGAGVSITYAPQIAINGNSPNIREEVERALEQSFARMMQKYQGRQTRLAY